MFYRSVRVGVCVFADVCVCILFTPVKCTWK